MAGPLVRLDSVQRVTWTSSRCRMQHRSADYVSVIRESPAGGAEFPSGLRSLLALRNYPPGSVGLLPRASVTLSSLAPDSHAGILGDMNKLACGNDLETAELKGHEDTCRLHPKPIWLNEISSHSDAPPPIPCPCSFRNGHPALPMSGFCAQQIGQRTGRPWLLNVRSGACSQAKNNIPRALLPTMR